MSTKSKFSIFEKPIFLFGRIIPDLVVYGRPAPFPVMNERAVRATAGLTMIAAGVAFSLAYFSKVFIPIKIVTVVFFFDFLIRTFTGLTPFSPFGLLGSFLVRDQEPEWVSAAPKRFAWSIGIAMALSMSLITNLNITGQVPFTICMICLTLMWMETSLGICVGCKIYNFLVNNNIIAKPEYAIICAGDSCAVPALIETPVLPQSNIRVQLDYVPLISYSENGDIKKPHN